MLRRSRGLRTAPQRRRRHYNAGFPIFGPTGNGATGPGPVFLGFVADQMRLHHLSADVGLAAEDERLDLQGAETMVAKHTNLCFDIPYHI